MRSRSAISVEDVLQLRRPTSNFLCPLSANTYGLQFLEFTIKDYSTKKVIFDISKDLAPVDPSTIDFTDENSYRKIKYEFSEDILRLPSISTLLVFKVGNREVRDFRMIERHYFRDRLIKSFDFTFGFCIPGSTNSWEAVYHLPPLSEELIEDMIANPHETTSDSFYFEAGKLIMHNKASYAYIQEDASGEKKSYDRDGTGMKLSKLTLDDERNSVNSDDMEEERKAQDKGGPQNGLGDDKKSAKWEEEEVWSKEDDYY